MVRRPLASLLALIALLVISAPPAGAATDASGGTGAVRFVKRMNSSFDGYVTNPSSDRISWLNKKLWRTEVFTPFFDSRTAFYGNGWVYSDIYAIYTGSSVASQHPDWILKDGSGRKLFIPWGCSNGTCPQYAADITNPDYRAWWISNLNASLSKGYRGAWIDDVNLEFRVGDASGNDVAPYSPALGRTMNATDWRRSMAEFTEQIRAAVPASKEILHNSIWYAAQDNGRDADPYVQREIASADYINLERGFNDGGLTGGSGDWSLKAMQGFIDRVHAKGKGVIVDAFDSSAAGMEYSLANYLLINTGRDGVGEMDMTPDNWWKGWDTDLGSALGDRYTWNGLMRRDFSGGMALVNEPGAPTRTVQLPTAMTTVDGRTVTSINLAGGSGAVLSGTGSTAAPSATPTPTPTPKPTATPKPTSGSGTTTVGTTTDSTCTNVRVTYPTLKWDRRRHQLVPAKGTSVVCIANSLMSGTRARRAKAVRSARERARKSSVRKAKKARRQSIRAIREAARH